MKMKILNAFNQLAANLTYSKLKNEGIQHFYIRLVEMPTWCIITACLRIRTNFILAEPACFIQNGRH